MNGNLVNWDIINCHGARITRFGEGLERLEKCQFHGLPYRLVFLHIEIWNVAIVKLSDNVLKIVIARV